MHSTELENHEEEERITLLCVALHSANNYFAKNYAHEQLRRY